MDLISPLPAFHSLALLGTFLLLGTTLAHADFPDVAQLPSHSELPAPLVQLTGERVTSKEQWFQKRRPELKGLFQYYMYGSFPPAEKITATGWTMCFVPSHPWPTACQTLRFWFPCIPIRPSRRLRAAA